MIIQHYLHNNFYISNILERILWADICKGVLISLLVFSHLVWGSRSFFQFQNQIIEVIGSFSAYVILGLFSNFNKPFWDFLLRNFKPLIIPTLVCIALYSIPSLNYNYFFNRPVLFGGVFGLFTLLILSELLLWICIKVKKQL
jgi:fucose 4-O-acetylase-like acetyltransferase